MVAGGVTVAIALTARLSLVWGSVRGSSALSDLLEVPAGSDRRHRFEHYTTGGNGHSEYAATTRGYDGRYSDYIVLLCDIIIYILIGAVRSECRLRRRYAVKRF